MYSSIRLWLFTVLLLVSPLCLRAQDQNYPVSVTPFFIAPESLEWSDFYGERLVRLSVVLKDNSQLSGNVKLFFRFRLERVGVVIENTADFVPSKGVAVNFGTPLLLSGKDLSENFLASNLESSGIDESLLRQGGQLPDGMWTLKVRAYEYDAARGYRALSNESSAMLMVYLGQPPLLTSPLNGSEWDTDRPNNLLFQWTPRASSTVGGMGGIAYQFELWELGSSENENDVASGKQPILSEVVNSPLFLYDASKAPLVQGKRYAWRVKVIDANRSRKFENEGYSEVWTFRYGVSCPIPSGLQVSKIGSGVLHLAWNGLSGVSSYQVRWQKSGEQVYSYQTTNFNFLDLNGVSDSNIDFEVRSLCKTGEYSDWSEVLSFVTPQGMAASSNKNPVNELSSTSTSSTPTDPLEQVVSSATVSDGDLAGFQSQYEQAPNVREQRCGGVVISQTSSCEIPQASSYGGAVPFSSSVNSTLYINGYEIVITKVVNDQEGEGLLYFPYLGKRIPVEWKGVSIREGEQPTYGCIVSGTVQAQGSNNNVLGDDLKRQYLALYNNLNNPGSFTGTFGQAIEAMKTKAQELLDKIGKGEKPTKEDYKGYNSICKAIDKGIDAWKQSLEDQYGATTSIAAVQQLYRDLATTKSDLLSELSCDGTGYVPFAREEEVFYASVSLSKERFKLPTLENYLVSKCKLEQAESNASKLLSLIESEKELKNTPQDPSPQVTFEEEKEPSFTEVIGKLTQLQLISSYQEGHSCADYDFVSFKDAGCLYSTGSSIMPKVVYYGQPSNWETAHHLWLVADKYWICQYDSPLSFKYYDGNSLQWKEVVLPKGQTAGEAFADVFAQSFALLLTSGVGIGTVAMATAEQTAQRCIINGSIDLVIQGILYGGWEAYQQGKLPKEVLPLVWDRISLISVAGSCGTGIIENCGVPCQSFSTGLIAGVQDIYDQYKETKDLSKVNYNQATLRAATTAVIAGLLNSGLSFSKFSLSSSALFGAKLAWLRPNLFANLMTLTRAERTQLAEVLQTVSDDVLTSLENPAFFTDFSKAILASGSTPSSGILTSLIRLKSWVNSWIGIKDKALKWVRSTTLTGTLGIMTLTGTPQVEARIIDNSPLIQTVLRVPNAESGLLSASSSEVSSVMSQGISVAEVEASQLLDPTGEVLGNSSGTYELLQSSINSIQNILVRLKTSSNTSAEPIILIKDGKTYKIGDDSKCVYCGKTVLKPTSGNDATEYTLCQDLNTLQARGGTNGTAGVTKLCSAFPTVASLRPIVTKLLTLQNSEIQAFFGDIAPSTCGGSAYLCGNVNSLTVGLIDAWKLENDAVNTSTRRLNRDWKTLTTIQDIQVNKASTLQSLLTVSGLSGGFKTILQAYSVADCPTCENTSTYGIPDLAEVWQNATYILNLHNQNVVGARNLITGSSLFHPSNTGFGWGAKSGANHMIKDIRSRGWTSSNISGIDQGLPNSSKRYDLQKSNGTGFVEYKSYSEDYGIGDITGIGSGSWKDFDQFLAYLKQPQVQDMGGNSLEYVFDAKKIPNVGDIKTAFQKLMYDGKNLTTQGTEVFNTIWGNNNLAGNLFGNRLEPAAKLYFTSTLVSDISSSFYNFINVK